MNNIKQPICYFLIGLPGSGKSTWADDLIIKNPELEIVSMDYFIEQEAVRQNKKYNDVYREFAETAEKLMKQKLSEIIKEKKSFIWDQINISENIRRKKIARLKQNKYEIHAIAFSLNEETWKNRLDNRVNLGGKIISKKVLEEMKQNFVFPNINEGFSSLVIIGDKSFTPSPP